MQILSHLNKAWACFSRAQYRQAIFHAQRACAINPNLPEIYFIDLQSKLALGITDADLLNSAKLACERFKYQHPELLTTLSQISYAVTNDIDIALDLVDKSIKLKNDYHTSWVHKSFLKFTAGDFLEAIKCAEEAQKIKLDDLPSLINMAASLKEVGEVDRSIKIYERVLNITPHDEIAWTNYLFTLLFRQKSDTQILAKAARKRANTLPEPKIEKYKYTPKPGKIILALISADLYKHACAYFIIPFVANLDRTKYEIHIFYINKVKDNVTEKIQRLSDQFYHCGELSNLQVTKLIRSKQCDVAIDLGGFTGRSPVSIISPRVAPIQVSWLGYPATTGESNIDYRITDKYSDLDHFRTHYTEELLDLEPCFCIYYPKVQAPLDVFTLKYQVKSPPFMKNNGRITFGSTNNIAKITNETISLWAEILFKIPESDLLIEGVNVESHSVNKRIIDYFSSSSISIKRIKFTNRNISNQYLIYNEIDILLDTSPLTGGTTTCDALWMGTPIITLAKESFHTRMTATFLHACGYSELIAFDEDSYVNIAVNLSKNKSKITDYKKRTRAIFEFAVIYRIKHFISKWDSFIDDKIHKSKPPKTDQNLIYFGKNGHTENNIKISLAKLIHDQNIPALYNMLDNLATVSYKNWLILFGLSMLKTIERDIPESRRYLLEAILICEDISIAQRMTELFSRSAEHKSLNYISNYLKNKFGVNIDVTGMHGDTNYLDVLGLNK